jgi:hypothetical protein
VWTGEEAFVVNPTLTPYNLGRVALTPAWTEFVVPAGTYDVVLDTSDRYETRAATIPQPNEQMYVTVGGASTGYTVDLEDGVPAAAATTAVGRITTVGGALYLRHRAWSDPAARTSANSLVISRAEFIPVCDTGTTTSTVPVATTGAATTTTGAGTTTPTTAPPATTAPATTSPATTSPATTSPATSTPATSTPATTAAVATSTTAGGTVPPPPTSAIATTSTSSPGTIPPTTADRCADLDGDGLVDTDQNGDGIVDAADDRACGVVPPPTSPPRSLPTTPPATTQPGTPPRLPNTGGDPGGVLLVALALVVAGVASSTARRGPRAVRS